MKFLLPLAVAASTFLAGTEAANPGTFEWTPQLAGYFDVVFRYIQDARAPGAQQPSCDLSRAAMPIAPTPLPTPPGLKLAHVAVGRGVQNYTCANATATPAGAGAIAKFYNASCTAADYPDLLSLLPNIALQYPLPEGTENLQPANLELTVDHFFTNTTTPVFAFDQPNSPDLGRVYAQLGNSSLAPSNSITGVNGKGDGTIGWLYLTPRSTTEGGIKAVYRLNTAGGSPPATCRDMPATFSVEYAANYWFYE